MIEWNETELAVRDMVRRFVAQEIEPNLQELEHGSLPPYAVLRKLFATFGLRTWRNATSSARFARDNSPDAGTSEGASRRLDRGRSGAGVCCR